MLQNLVWYIISQLTLTCSPHNTAIIAPDLKKKKKSLSWCLPFRTDRKINTLPHSYPSQVNIKAGFMDPCGEMNCTNSKHTSPACLKLKATMNTDSNRGKFIKALNYGSAAKQWLWFEISPFSPPPPPSISRSRQILSKSLCRPVSAKII